MALVLEASAPKPGNVSRLWQPRDTSYQDYLRSGLVLGAALPGYVRDHGPGGGFARACALMRSAIGRNTHMGALLLLAPLIRACQLGPLSRGGVEAVVEGMGPDDAALISEAVRLTSLRGIAPLEAYSVFDPETPGLLRAGRIGVREWMRMGASVNLVARELAEGYPLAFGVGAPLIRRAWSERSDIELGAVRFHLFVLAEVPDTHLAAEAGQEAAEEVRSASVDAAAAFEEAMDRWAGAGANAPWWAGPPGDVLRGLHELVRARGSTAGAAADVVAAALFIALWELDSLGAALTGGVEEGGLPGTGA